MASYELKGLLTCVGCGERNHITRLQLKCTGCGQTNQITDLLYCRGCYQREEISDELQCHGCDTYNDVTDLLKCRGCGVWNRITDLWLKCIRCGETNNKYADLLKKCADLQKATGPGEKKQSRDLLKPTGSGEKNQSTDLLKPTGSGEKNQSIDLLKPTESGEKNQSTDLLKPTGSIEKNEITNLLLKCTGCGEKLNFDSKTLPCLHSFCCLCLEKEFAGRTNGIEQCPECQEPMALGQLSLSPFLLKSLRRQQLETGDWKCDVCSEDAIESIGSNFCNICQKIFCTSCSRSHDKFVPDHKTQDLNGIDKNDVIEAMVKDICSFHHKEQDVYCERRNMCICDVCYQNHSANFPGYLSQPLSAKKEALELKSQGPGLAKEMDDLRTNLQNVNETMRDYTEKLNSECDLKCKQLWENYEDIMQYAKQKTEELCEEVRQSTANQAVRWHLILEENENFLKQLEIWHQNLDSLLNDSQQNGDVVCGLKLLKAMISSRLHKSVELAEEPQLNVSYPDWWLQIMEEIESRKNVSRPLVSDTLNVNNLVLETEWDFNRSDLQVYSVYIDTEANHIFIVNNANSSVMEYTQWGILICECKIFDKNEISPYQEFNPYRMCSVSPDSFVVACGSQFCLIFLERKKVPPFLRIKNVVMTSRRYTSLMERNGSLFACTNDDAFEIDSLSKENEIIETIQTQIAGSDELSIIHADSSTGNFWAANRFTSEIFCYNFNGEPICSVKSEDPFSDFCVDEFGNLYFCNEKGIFSFSPVKNMNAFENESESGEIISFSPQKTMYTFENEPETSAKIFTVKNRIFLYSKIDGKHLMKIFKVFTDQEYTFSS